MRARVKPAVWAAWCAQSGITGHPEHEYQPVEDTDRVGNHRLSWPFWWWKLEELDFEPPGTASELQTAHDSRRMIDDLDLALESLSYVHGGFSAPSVEEAKRRIRSVRDLLRRGIEDPGRNTSR